MHTNAELDIRGSDDEEMQSVVPTAPLREGKTVVQMGSNNVVDGNVDGGANPPHMVTGREGTDGVPNGEVNTSCLRRWTEATRCQKIGSVSACVGTLVTASVLIGLGAGGVLSSHDAPDNGVSSPMPPPTPISTSPLTHCTQLSPFSYERSTPDREVSLYYDNSGWCTVYIRDKNDTLSCKRSSICRPGPNETYNCPGFGAIRSWVTSTTLSLEFMNRAACEYFGVRGTTGLTNSTTELTNSETGHLDKLRRVVDSFEAGYAKTAKHVTKILDTACSAAEELAKGART